MIKRSDKKRVDNKNVFTWIIVVFLTVYSVSLVVPLLYGFVNSFKDGMFEFNTNKFGLPHKITFENYINAFSKLYIYIDNGTGGRFVYAWEMLFNSLLLSLGCTFISLISHMLVAYACARYRFRLNKILYTIVLVTMLLPIVGALPSYLRIMKILHLYDTFIGMLCLKGGFTGSYFLVFYAIFRSIDMSYTEAAKIDGAGHWQTMLRIVFPLARSTVVGVGLLLFIGFWNNYYDQMVYLPSMPTISYGLFTFQTYVTSGIAKLVTVRLAACFLVCVPILILFVIFRNKIMGNISIGGVKG